MDFFIFIVSCVLYFPLSVVNFLLVRNPGYLKDTGITLSKLANRDLRTMFNKFLKQQECGHKFGSCDETVSSALGKNQILGTLTKSGRVLVILLHRCEKHHCLKSVHDPDYEEQKKALMNKK